MNSKGTLGVVCGRTMRVGEVPQAGDWRFTGYRWEPVPEPFIGHSIQPGSGMVYIRPEEDYFPRK